MTPSVGFYAGLNLIAWFMVFCFVRETKQLTLEELDRKQNLASYSCNLNSSDVLHRGLLGSDKEVHFSRIDRVAPLFYQAAHFPKGRH